MDISEKVTNRFLKYVSFDTQSDESSTSAPSTDKQLEFARYLENEFKEIGFTNVEVGKHGYVYATLPASSGYEDKNKIAYFAHMDTAPDAPGANIQTMITEENNEHVIRTDRMTLLGADDKAGLCEIVTACELMLNDESLLHPEIRIVVTNDEEIGRGVDHIDLNKVNASYAYTVDGSEVGDLEYECFNAANVKVDFRGYSIHTGDAYGIMKNTLLMANDFLNNLPPELNPAKTKDREGFIHPYNINGNVSKLKLELLLRDFDEELFERQKTLIQENCRTINDKYGEGSCFVTIEDTYKNMKNQIVPEYSFLLDNVRETYKELGIVPIETPIRGGTDGATFSFLGCPTPNLGTGSYNHHGRFEYVSLRDFTKMLEIVKALTLAE